MLNIGLNKIKFIGAVFFVTFLSLAGKAFAYDVSVTTSASVITVSTSDSQVKSISLSVSNPSGDIVFSERTAGRSIAWSLASGSIDGHYKYEATLTNVAAGSRTRGQTIKVVPMVGKKSGAVLVQAGQFVSPKNEESEEQSSLLLDGIKHLASSILDMLIPSAHADELINDDLISNGSLCVGLDCVNGENFGFDSIRLKENNNRMHFNDTSNSASFPGNDWRFLFNDTTNGGSSYFSVEDATTNTRIFTLDAGAPANSLYVDTSGRIGVGTSNPNTALEMVSGNSPTIRLNQDASLGFSAQSWDLLGNEEGFFLRDVSAGSAIPFRIAPATPSNSVVVAASGHVGLGTDTPTETLHVMGNAIISGNLELGSSRAIKNQIKKLGLEQAIQAFRSLEPVMFKYNHSPHKQSIGFIAEDVPDLVATESRKSLKTMDIVAVLTKVVQEQQNTIDKLSEQVDALLAEKN